MRRTVRYAGELAESAEHMRRHKTMNANKSIQRLDLRLSDASPPNSPVTTATPDRSVPSADLPAVPVVGAIVSVEPERRQTPDLVPWEAALTTWLDQLDRDTTRRNYAATIRLLFSVPGMPQFIEEVDTDLLGQWRGALVQRANLPPGSPERIAAPTVKRHLSAARSFFSFCRAKGWVRFHLDDLALALKQPRGKVERPYQVLDTAEIGALLAAARRVGRSASIGVRTSPRVARQQVWTRIYRGSDAQLVQRDVAILTTALGTGLRMAELAALDVADLRYLEGTWWVDVREGKGRKARQVPIDSRDAELLLAYIAATGRNFAAAGDRATPLWLSRRRQRLSDRHLRRLIDGIADVAQTKGQIAPGKHISPHALRHTLAIQLLRGDPTTGRRRASAVEVKKVLGHENLATTQRYLEHLERADLVGLVGLAPRISAWTMSGPDEG